jgi:hypothetical protein
MTVEFFPGPDSDFWTVPAGVFSVFVEAVGGGGGGSSGHDGDSLQFGGDGGGGAGYGAAVLAVIPGGVYSRYSSGGGDSSDFGPAIVRGGGGGGGPFPWSGGTDNIGTITVNGGDGAPSPMIVFGNGGVGGASAVGGSAGTAGIGAVPGPAGNGGDGGFAGGGGGGGGGALVGAGSGGAGAVGYIRLTYTIIYLGSPSPSIDNPGSPIVPGNTITIPGTPDTESCLDTITSVTFNGIPASFSIVDGNLIIIVPPGVSGNGILEVTSDCGVMDFAYIAENAVGCCKTVVYCCKVCAPTSSCPLGILLMELLLKSD